MSDNLRDAFDDKLRDKLSGWEAPYSAPDWKAMETLLGPPPRRRKRAAAWFALPLVIGLGAGLWWWLDGSAEHPATGADSAAVAVIEQDERPARSEATGSAAQSDLQQETSVPASIESLPAESAGFSAPAATVANSHKKTYGVDASPLTRKNQTAALRPEKTALREQAVLSIAEIPAEQSEAAEVNVAEEILATLVEPVPADHLGEGSKGRISDADPTLKKNRRLMHWAVSAASGLTAAYTGPGDGYRPGWEAGLGAEVQFRNGVLVATGIRYGDYHFQMNDVGCGNPVAYGIKEPVHCPDAMLGDQGRWEIPLYAGYVSDLEKIRGRIRAFGGFTVRRTRTEDYWVQFNNASPSMPLFYEPVSITVTDPEAGTLVFNADGLVESTSQYTVQPVGPEQTLISTSIGFAAEAGFGYEQFLAPSVSLGIEPRFGIPFKKLDITDRRAYYGGLSARIRWYPTIRR